jgi:hypothetical protein
MLVGWTCFPSVFDPERLLQILIEFVEFGNLDEISLHALMSSDVLLGAGVREGF